MEKADKWMFVLVTALIYLSIAWFAQFSQTQQNLTHTVAVAQILDAVKADNADWMTIHSKRASVNDTGPNRSSRNI